MVNTFEYFPGTLPFGCISHTCLFFMTFSDGTFPVSNLIVTGTPKIRANMSFMALGNPGPALQNRICYRSCSCSCHVCTMGSFHGCENEAFVPSWSSQLLTFRLKPPPNSLARHTANIRTWLQTLKRQKNVFPVYYCLAWRPNIQQPTILHMTHMRSGDQNVRCHVLPLHDATPNDFGHCKCRLPNVLCPRTIEECHCNGHHAQLLPIADILEVAVFRENGS